MSLPSWSRIDLGIGYSSFTSGQSIPALTFLYLDNSLGVEFTSTGYTTPFDYLWGKTLSVYYSQVVGVLFYQPVEFGLGGGVYQSQRGFLTSAVTRFSSTTDRGFGPAFFVAMHLGEDIFLRLQSMYNVGHEHNVQLYFQDISTFSIGAHW